METKQTLTIYDLWKKVQGHPDYLGGTVFTTDDAKVYDIDPEYVSVSNVEDTCVHAGIEYFEWSQKQAATAEFPPPPEDPDEDRAYQAYSDRQVNGEAR